MPRLREGRRATSSARERSRQSPATNTETDSETVTDSETETVTEAEAVTEARYPRLASGER